MERDTKGIRLHRSLLPAVFPQRQDFFQLYSPAKLDNSGVLVEYLFPFISQEESDLFAFFQVNLDKRSEDASFINAFNDLCALGMGLPEYFTFSCSSWLK